MNEHQTLQFEQRKRDHIQLSLDLSHQTVGLNGLNKIHLFHEALPEINYSEVSISQNLFKESLPTPFLVSSMTAGHSQASELNSLLALACQRRGWLMGVGSQRRQLTELAAEREWKAVRKIAPKAKLLGNIGLAELIRVPVDQVQKLVESLDAFAMMVHTNPLQEAIQPEGNPDFKGGLRAIEQIVKVLEVPVVVKETGCGFSEKTLGRLQDVGVAAVDVSGLGGTHWGRIEGSRCLEGSPAKEVSKTFSNWGESTFDSLVAGRKWDALSLWASGGIRSGLDAAKTLALGADIVGFAQPILEAVLKGEDELDLKMQQMEQELTTALFCTGSARIAEIREEEKWQIKE
ncbi:MAG: type 2 isopentenyl-diphosphate Delta-isomerase [Bdellovibrionales bacterium]|nr:type 2 isopentenyl-diphosphate Delta-isomerase [Bdellovibrionales bacterium]